MSNVRRDDERTGDPAVDQAWRAAATDEPSVQLDATILAEARAAAARVKSAPTPPAKHHWWAHWQPLAAAAGVAGLAFTIVQMLPREADVPAAPSAERAIERARPGHTESVTQQNAAPLPAPPEADTEHPATAKRASPAESPPSQPSAAAASREIAPPPTAPTTAEDWARHIETLYFAGDQTAATDALQAFREAYPGADQYLAESLQPWAASVDERPAEAKEPAGITP
ncbi:MAG TPA: hypothetical protein VLH36_00470 [Steroidobacteraceae bacterium]|nr:hypothetical protein [Steroidobacteraceae bacterium]